MRKNEFNLIEYLAEMDNGKSRLPSLNALSKEQGISISVLREQLQVARVLGFVEVRPKTGIRRLPYHFTPALDESLAYGLSLDRSLFDQFADLRAQVEASFWFQAVAKLETEDIDELIALVQKAKAKLNGEPIRLPHREHRDLHLKIFSKVGNPFVFGIIEAYWNAYETVGLNRYAGLAYLKEVWDFHEEIIKAISDGDHQQGHKLMVEHMALIGHRSK